MQHDPDVSRLDALGFDRLKKSAKRGKGSSQNDEDDDLEEGGPSKSKQPAGQKVSYDYLLSMPLWSLSLEKVQELQNEYEGKRDCVAKIKGTDPKDMWLSDIDHLEETLEVCEAEEAKLKAELDEQQERARTGKAAKGGRGAKGKAAKGKAAAAPKKMPAGVAVAPPVVEVKAPSKRAKAAPAKKKITQVDSDSEEDFMPQITDQNLRDMLQGAVGIAEGIRLRFEMDDPEPLPDERPGGFPEVAPEFRPHR